MKKYLKNMRVPLILVGIMLLLYILLICFNITDEKEYERGNYNCPEQRVYDYADILTDDEEQKLEELIAKRQDQIGCDIVLVIINEPLRDYVANYVYQIDYVPEDEYVMYYADNFYDENEFGYDRPWGDGCVFVDNWDRSESVYGYAYNWLSTSGRVEDRFSTGDINSVIDDVNARINESPYEAYYRYVEDIYHMMSNGRMEDVEIPFYAIVVIAAIAAVIYIAVHLSSNKGKKTTVGTTYVNGGRPFLRNKSDVLINTHVTRRHIQRSSSGGGGGGGGGHHTSSGGHSHGGGGGHH